MNGLGHCVGASLFPKSQFDEQTLFVEIVSVIAQMENWMVYVNDMMSYYKESMAERDQTSLVNNYVQCEEITLNEALDKLTRDTIHCSEQMVAVFEGKDPQLVATLKAFVQGYVTWHLCDARYRLSELNERGKNTPTGMKFREYQEKARKVGAVDAKKWAVPTVAALVEQGHSSTSSNVSSEDFEKEKRGDISQDKTKSKWSILCGLLNLQ
jgi:trichodiene synthase